MRAKTGLATIAVSLLAGLLMTAANTAEAQQGEPWLAVLKLQLQQSNSCLLDEVLFVREVPLGKEMGMEGRVRCIDRREYDFTRQRQHQKFDIRLCQPAVC